MYVTPKRISQRVFTKFYVAELQIFTYKMRHFQNGFLTPFFAYFFDLALTVIFLGGLS